MKSLSIHTIATRRRTLLKAAATAVAALLVGGAPASAQYQVQQDGSTLDANPRLGSGGYNSQTGAGTGSYGNYGNYYNSYQFGEYGNNVVTGNVTGGRAFRGNVGYRDARAFRDSVGGELFDAFNRSASGVTTSGRVIDNAGQARAYYGDTTVAAPPPGFVRTPGSGGYVPPKLTGFTADLDDLNAARRAGINTPEDQQSDLSRAFSGGGAEVDVDAALSSDLNRYGRYNAPEGLLLGNRLTAGADGRSLADANRRSLSPYTQLGRDDRLSGFTGDRLRALGGELLRTAEGDRVQADDIDSLLRPRQPRDPNVTDDARTQGGTAGSRLDNGNNGQEALEAIERGARAPGRLAGADDPVLRLADPAEQSAQYAQLERRLDRFKADPYADVIRPRGVERDGQDEDATLPGFGALFGGETALGDTPATGGTGIGGGAGVGDIEEADGADQAPADPPVLIESFAAGVTSPTLKSLLAEAEQLMANGQYVTAATRYAAAERLVPNQPLVSLGRATAELGAGYYRRAADNLRQAFDRSPALTMARVDTTELLGADRVAAVAENLRQLAEKDEKAADPLFLLAFLSYGEGRYAQAATLLDLAEQRSKDPFYTAVKKMWALDTRPAEEGHNAAPTTRPDAAQPDETVPEGEPSFDK